MSAISVRLPASLHERARQLAKKEKTSVNNLITLALAEKIAVLEAEEFLGTRANRASKRKFQKAMSKIRDTEPVERDRL